MLRDVTFEAQSGIVLSLTVDEKEIAPDRVIGFGKKAVVLRAPSHDALLFKRASSSKKKKAAPVPPEDAVLQEDAPAETLPATETEERQHVFPDYDFLLGRTVLKNITNGEIIVAERSDVVTPDVILRARDNGKLVELTVNSRK